MSNDALAARLADVAAPIVAAEGVELVDVEVKGHPGSRVVRLFVDADDGVDIELCARISRAVGEALDDDDVIAGRYTLQVSSPGIDRPLRGERDFRRNVGRQVRVVAAAAAEEIVGDVVAVGDGTLTLEVDGEPVELPLDDVDHGKVLLPW